MSLTHDHSSSLLEFVTQHAAELNLRERRFARGTMLVMPHDNEGSVYVIRHGRLRVFTPTKHGTDVFLAELGAGEIVGEVAAISGRQAVSVVEATEETHSYVFSPQAFLQVLRTCPDGALQVMQTLCDRLNSMNRRHIEYVTLPMAARLAAEFSRLARRGRDGILRIECPPTHAELAEKIGSQREAVTKEIRNLARRGILKASRVSIEIIRPDQLL